MSLLYVNYTSKNLPHTPQTKGRSKETLKLKLKKKKLRDFPCGAVVKNPPTNAGDTGSIPGPGRSHMPQGN